MRILGLGKGKVRDNPRPDSPEEGEIVHTYGWDWYHYGDGSYRSWGDSEHLGPFVLRYQGTRVERTNGGFLLRGWWSLEAPERYEEDQVGLITGSAAYTEACSFAWQRITGKSWPSTPTLVELARKEIVSALGEIEMVIGDNATWSPDHTASVNARDALERALDHLSWKPAPEEKP